MSCAGPLAGELRKSSSLSGLRRTIWIGALGVLVVTSFAVIQTARFTALGRAGETGGTRVGDWPMFVLNMGQVVPVLIGAWVFGQDDGTGPRRLALLAVPGRRTLAAAKTTTVVLLCAAAAVLCACAAVLPLLLAGGGGPPGASDPPSPDRFCWLAAYWVLIGVVSASVTAAARSMVAAIVPVLAWTLGVSSLLTQRIHVLGGALDQVFRSAYLDGTTPTVVKLVSAALQVVVIVSVCLAVYVRRDAD
ncbi:hypothetical protein [uncultured Propionibacterium sp.]|uniref:hypothetical protein n=1 Tax=uncultured Propionibacterium sp. TaxID=218066 RepID=UPI0029313FCD|nr:hypothetical protein [uncultured Propionibacterium sp.]